MRWRAVAAAKPSASSAWQTRLDRQGPSALRMLSMALTVMALEYVTQRYL